MGDICGNRRISPGIPADIFSKFHKWIKKLKKDKIETGGCIGQLEDISQKKKQENHSEKKNGKRALGIQCPHLAKEMSKIKPKVQ
ncbi:hypothetical protein B5E53_06430 [Eubacterium sp. An11]|nr:hypothetical protein B5E53_06430 [Eubacterium sp. An11]